MAQLAQEGIAIAVYIASATAVLVYAMTTVISAHSDLVVSTRLSIGSSLYTTAEKLSSGDCIRLYSLSRQVHAIISQLNGTAAVTVRELGDCIEVCKRG